MRCYDFIRGVSGLAYAVLQFHTRCIWSCLCGATISYEVYLVLLMRCYNFIRGVSDLAYAVLRIHTRCIWSCLCGATNSYEGYVLSGSAHAVLSKFEFTLS